MKLEDLFTFPGRCQRLSGELVDERIDSFTKFNADFTYATYNKSSFDQYFD